MDANILLIIFVSFIAQLIDGSLGMAYGVSANSMLLSLGLPPAAASASVHASKIVTTFISGLAHLKVGNIDRHMVVRLLIPGMLGGIVGAYVLVSVDGDLIRPYIALYLLVMGVRILLKAFSIPEVSDRQPGTGLLVGLGLIGGTCDAIGGGGWGPVVTSTLISAGHSPRKTIGSVNFSEFFVTLAESMVFIFTIGLSNWKIILALIIGGFPAAPLGALLTRKLPARTIMIMVGCLIIFLQVRTLYPIWF